MACGHEDVDDTALEVVEHCVSLRWRTLVECQSDVGHTVRPVEDLV